MLLLVLILVMLWLASLVWLAVSDAWSKGEAVLGTVLNSVTVAEPCVVFWAIIGIRGRAVSEFGFVVG